MKIYRDEKYVKRRKAIGQYSGLLAILVLGGGMYLSFQYQEQILFSLLALIFGFIFSQISIFYTNRFGRSPRPDEEIDTALKGLDDRYGLYHYQTPVSHLLVGPAGVWILLPFYQKGKIVYQEKRQRWRRIGGNFYMKFFAQDSIGRPSQEIAGSKNSVSAFLADIPGLQPVDPKAALIFTHDNAQVEADNAPTPTLHINQLKKMIRKEAKGNEALSMTAVKTIQDALELS